MSNSLLAVKRTEFFGVPWVAKNAMEKLKGYVGFPGREMTHFNEPVDLGSFGKKQRT